MLVDKQIKKVAIIGYNRIPFARQNTNYAEVGNIDMNTDVLSYHTQ